MTALRRRLRRVLALIAQGSFVQESDALPVVRLPRRVRSRRPHRRRRAYKVCATGASRTTSACETSRDLYPRRRDGARPCAARARDELRARGGGGHGEDDPPRRPHRVAPDPRPGHPRPDRRRHLQRERRNHLEAPTARADGARPRAKETPLRARRLAAALDVLERAAISTLHAFCAALLQERPLDAGVTPGFRVAEGAEADILFAEAWDEWIARVSNGATTPSSPPSTRTSRSPEHPYGEKQSLRGLARDLIEQRDLEPLVGPTQLDATAWREELMARASQAEALLATAAPTDLLASHLAALVAHARSAPVPHGQALLDHRTAFADALKGLSVRSGNKRSWRSPEALAEARDIAGWALASCGEWAAARSVALACAARRRGKGGGRALLRQEGRTRGPGLPRPPSEGGRCLALLRLPPALLLGTVPLPDHRRVPGHRSPPGEDRRSARGGPTRRSGSGGRSQAVDLPVPARGRSASSPA